MRSARFATPVFVLTLCLGLSALAADDPNAPAAVAEAPPNESLIPADISVTRLAATDSVA